MGPPDLTDLQLMMGKSRPPCPVLLQRMKAQHRPDGTKKGKASSRELQLKLGSKIKIATWNVRSMSSGKLQNVIAEAEKKNINILGIAEHRWGGQGHVSTIEGGK